MTKCDTETADPPPERYECEEAETGPPIYDDLEDIQGTPHVQSVIVEVEVERELSVSFYPEHQVVECVPSIVQEPMHTCTRAELHTSEYDVVPCSDPDDSSCQSEVFDVIQSVRNLPGLRMQQHDE